MTHEEMEKKVTDCRQRDHEQKDALTAYVRSLVPLLKDHNLSNTAKKIEEHLFQIDAANQELTDLFASDPVASMEFLMSKLGNK